MYTQTDKKDKGKSFKAGYVVLKDNFIFIYKSQNEVSPIDYFLVIKQAVSAEDDKYGKPNCFVVENHVFSCNDSAMRDDWIESINNNKKWFETSMN